jgi:hypothetical protein
LFFKDSVDEDFEDLVGKESGIKKNTVSLC